MTAAGKTYELPLPFFVLATQNPIEHEGTYPLPEAQLDRFFFNILIDYPSREEEAEIVKQTTGMPAHGLSAVLKAEEIIQLQELVRKVPVSDHTVQYAIGLAASTRPKDPGAGAQVKELVDWGAGPRASQALIVGAKARAVLSGRLCASIEDVSAVALPVLRHRLVLSFKAQAEGITPDALINRLVSAAAPK